MLDIIKSVYILKINFSLLNDKRKLKLIKYNKNLQSKININITHYKIFSGRFIVYENEGKEKNQIRGKEYDFLSNSLKYEGEYLNGERHGEGEEYDYSGNVIFKGKYKKGKRWSGKGNLYEIKEGKGYIKENDIDNFIFEGEYLNGEKNGKGIEYYNNILKFEGEYLNGKRWNGKGYDANNKLIYELKNGKGYVKEYNYNDNCLLFEGEYLNGEKNGKGKEYYKSPFLPFIYILGKRECKEIKIKYDGEYKNGLKHGQGKEYDLNRNLIFEGEYLYNYRKKGKAYVLKKLEYEGEYYCNKKWNGKGYDEKGNVIYELNDGTGFVKEYKDSKNIKIFEGNIIKGIKTGYGKEYDDFYGQLIYEGEFKNGKRNGQGKDIDIFTGTIFEGEYLNGRRNGKGKEYDSKGRLIFNGEFKNGIKVSKKYYYYFLIFIPIIISYFIFKKININ